MAKNCINCGYAECEYAKKICAGNFRFIGCVHQPYKGKWTAEIDQCPREEPKARLRS